MELTQADLFDMTKYAEETDATADNTTPGRKMIEKAKQVGALAAGGAGIAMNAINTMGTPAPVREISRI